MRALLATGTVDLVVPIDYRENGLLSERLAQPLQDAVGNSGVGLEDAHAVSRALGDLQLLRISRLVVKLLGPLGALATLISFG